MPTPGGSRPPSPNLLSTMDYSDIDGISAPTDLNVAAEFDGLRALVRRHVGLTDLGRQPRQHRELASLLDESRAVAGAAAGARERALHTGRPTPKTPAALEHRHRELVRARETHTAYALLLRALTDHCSATCSSR
jgi:hypothetical protein